MVDRHFAAVAGSPAWVGASSSVTPTSDNLSLLGSRMQGDLVGLNESSTKGRKMEKIVRLVHRLSWNLVQQDGRPRLD